jgi:3' terminal RNA ribose 2'-O-methyltransferase Hen1
MRADQAAIAQWVAPQSRVLDLGCGDGKLIARLIRNPAIEQIVGVEVSGAELARADQRFAELPQTLRSKLALLHGSLIYRDVRLRGFDAAALVEVIEHFEPDRLPHLERSVFGDAGPRLVVVTTPNRDYNVLFPGLPAGRFRHPDHRFEWSRDEFRGWAERVAAAHGYGVRFEGLGDEHPEYGAPGQIAVFTR